MRLLRSERNRIVVLPRLGHRSLPAGVSVALRSEWAASTNCGAATQLIVDAQFALGSLDDAECDRLTDLLTGPRTAAGDF
jgi:hypothetical protein